MTPRPQQPSKEHKIIITGLKPTMISEVIRYDKDTADFEYNHGVSLVNRNLASRVEWYLPDGKLYKKWG